MEQHIHKVGSIPFQIFKDKVAVLFVTSQVRGRWILPKGILVGGESHDDACHRETYKESGVKGRIIKNFPVTKRITKLTSKGIISTPVTFYPLLVQKQDDDCLEIRLVWILLTQRNDQSNFQEHEQEYPQ